MKFIIMLALALNFAACSRKYETIHAIKKKDFLFGEKHNPVMPKMYPGVKQTGEFCTGQWLFFNNAVRDTHEQLNRMVRVTCPKDDYLLNSRVTETWWTTIFYSRACIEIETHCPSEVSRRSSHKKSTKKKRR